MGPVFQCDHKIVPNLSGAVERPQANCASTNRLPALAKCLVPVVLLATLEAEAWGQTASVLAVERRPGAEGCPDVDALTSRVEHIRGHAADDVAVSYQITFAHDDSFSAIIRSSPDGTGVRTLEDRGATCAALAQATAVTLALLLDSDSAPADPPTPPPAVPAPAPKPPLVTTVASPERSSAVDATLTVGGSAMAGVIKDLAPALSGEAGINIARWHMGLGVWGAPPQDVALGPGVVRESLVGGVAQICYAPWRSDPFAVDVCSGGYFARLTAEGRNYSSTAEQTRSWLAIPLEMGANYGAGPVGVQLAAAALFPVQRQNFKIDNLGVAYESTPIAGMFSLRIIGRLKL